MIDLRSDTLTQPSAGMREAMARAEVGDDVYGEDPSVNRLERLCAECLGKSAALFVSSGTQSNLLAILAHCGRGDEYIVGQDAHTYRFEGGGAAVLGSVQPQPLDMNVHGEMALEAIRSAIKPDDFHFARTRLLCLENTHSGGVVSPEYIADIRELADAHALALHLDGARLFNAGVALGRPPSGLAEPFDSVSICLSKGLGAPVGSVLVGSEALIARARRMRKMLGGGMRQAGIIAAGGIFALENNVDRLAQDHAHAAQIGEAVAARFGPQSCTVQTNMVHLSLDPQRYQALAKALRAANVRVGRPRWVLHLDVTPPDVARVCATVAGFTG